MTDIASFPLGHLWCQCLRPNSPHGILCPLLYAGELRKNLEKCARQILEKYGALIWFDMGVWSLIWKTLKIIKIHWTPKKCVFSWLVWYGSLPWNTLRNTIPLTYHWNTWICWVDNDDIWWSWEIHGNRQGSLSIRNLAEFGCRLSHSWYVYL